MPDVVENKIVAADIEKAPFKFNRQSRLAGAGKPVKPEHAAAVTNAFILSCSGIRPSTAVMLVDLID